MALSYTGVGTRTSSGVRRDPSCSCGGKTEDSLGWSAWDPWGTMLRPIVHGTTAGAPPPPPPPHLIHLTSTHLTSPHLTSPHLTSPHLTSPHLTSPHLTSPHLNLTSPQPHLASALISSAHLTSPVPTPMSCTIHFCVESDHALYSFFRCARTWRRVGPTAAPWTLWIVRCLSSASGTKAQT